MPKSRHSDEQIATAITQMQESLRMLGRVKYGTRNQDSKLDGDGPVDEYFAIGVVRAKLQRALQTLGIEAGGPEL
jgi:hypothetical protein